MSFLQRDHVSTGQNTTLVLAPILLQAWTTLHVLCCHITARAEVQLDIPYHNAGLPLMLQLPLHVFLLDLKQVLLFSLAIAVCSNESLYAIALPLARKRPQVWRCDCKQKLGSAAP